MSEQLPQAPSQINDANGKAVVKFAGVASAVNEITLKNAAAGGAPEVQISGEADVDLNLRPKGIGKVKTFGGDLTVTGGILYGETTNSVILLNNSVGASIGYLASTLTLDSAKASLKSNGSDGPTALGTVLDTLNSFATEGAKLLSVRNATVEKASIDKDGDANVLSVNLNGSGGTAPANGLYQPGGNTLSMVTNSTRRVDVNETGFYPTTDGAIPCGKSGNRWTEGNFSDVVRAKGLNVIEGANARLGTATLVAGTVTVATTAVTANSRIFLTGQSPGGTPGGLNVSARIAGTSFTITSTNAADTSLVAWMLVEPV